ncbi:galactokinase [Tropicimonas sp.]|uniref:galactokinase n=1 Tax=Tropicimonas sp. TaxID=2067044 RepID=UPI003A8B144A
MSDIDRTGAVATAFQRHFVTAAEVSVFAPGRVNLLGEHTDYNGGYVLPMALNGLGVSIAVARGGTPGRIDAYSETFDLSETRDIDEKKADTWSDYVLGCFQALARDEIADTGCQVALATTVPLGAGLSSSAALEVACFRAMSELYAKPMTPVEIAVAARAVENGFVGMPCGIMDQFASSVGHPGEALFLDTRNLVYDYAPRPSGHAFVIVHSGVSHQLTNDGYATRVAECQAAGAALGVELLSDLGPDDLDRVNALPEPLNRRARHVITDNRRVLDGVAALKADDPAAFGRLMVESHASQRDDYAITVPETDALVVRAMELGAVGARQTGGGFGGSIVALVRNGDVERWGQEIVGDLPGVRVLAVT